MKKLQSISIPKIQVFVEPVKEHRFVVVFRGVDGANVEDTDPQVTGVEPLPPQARDSASQRTAQGAAEFIAQARKILHGQPKANGLTLRGFAAKPKLPSYQEVYGLKAAAIAVRVETTTSTSMSSRMTSAMSLGECSSRPDVNRASMTTSLPST